MRKIILITIVYLLCSAERCTPRVGPNLKMDGDSCLVTVKVTYTSPYCGGARPSDQMLEDSKKPKPLPGQLFYVKPGKENSMSVNALAQAETDTSGKMVFKLPLGKYMLLLPVQTVEMDTNSYVTNQYYRYDRKCLIEWWKKPVIVFDVYHSGESTVNVHLTKKCFLNGWSPCEYYIGPKPP
jgi:hypothetical protein